MQFLRDFHLQVPFIHRTALTKTELHFNFNRWLHLEPAEDYPILYLSFHGRAGILELEDNSKISLQAVGECLASQCENRVIHFASCETLDTTLQDLDDFLDKTEASAVSGYTEEYVDWVQSMALDLMYLELMQCEGDENLTPTVMGGVRESLMHERPYVGLRRHLGLRLRVAT